MHFTSYVSVFDDDVSLQDLAIGCVLAICGNLLISVSLNLQVKLFRVLAYVFF